MRLKTTIMSEMIKHAKARTKELEKRGGVTEEHAIIGFKMFKKDWRVAKEAGFERQADGIWTAHTESYGGNGGYADRAYAEVLKMYQDAYPLSFLDDVYIYEYLT